MSKARKIFMWAYMLTKKHLYRWSFPLLLFVIICSAPIMSHMLGADDAILNIAVFPGKDKLGGEIARDLMNDESVVSYTLMDSAGDAVSGVRDGEYHGAWIIDDNLSKKLSDYADGIFSGALISVVEREETVALKLSREKLYGKLFPHITYNIYKKYIREQIGDEDKISDKKIEKTYKEMKIAGNPIEIRAEGSDRSYDMAGGNILLSPVRGFLSILIILCGLGAGLYFIKEKEEGVYARLGERQQFIPAFGSCIGAVTLSALAAYLSMHLAGMLHSPLAEFANILLFILTASLFCTAMCLIFKSVALFGALIPPVVILMLIMCPIFFNVKFAVWPKYLLPPYYYLMSVYNPEYMWYSLVYDLVLGMCIRLISALKKQ